MRENYTQAPPRLRLAIEQSLATEGPMCAAQRATAAGFDFWPVKTPWLDEIAKFEAAGNNALAATVRAEHDAELTIERAALVFMQARREWARDTSIEDDRKARAADAEITRKAARDAAIAARAIELRDADDAARLARFTEQATAEIDAAHPAPEPSPTTVNAIAPQAPKRARPAQKAVTP